jgi:hypothetical protein
MFDKILDGLKNNRDLLLMLIVLQFINILINILHYFR